MLPAVIAKLKNLTIEILFLVHVKSKAEWQQSLPQGQKTIFRNRLEISFFIFSNIILLHFKPSELKSHSGPQAAPEKEGQIRGVKGRNLVRSSRSSLAVSWRKRETSLWARQGRQVRRHREVLERTGKRPYPSVQKIMAVYIKFLLLCAWHFRGIISRPVVPQNIRIIIFLFLL